MRTVACSNSGRTISWARTLEARESHHPHEQERAGGGPHEHGHRDEDVPGVQPHQLIRDGRGDNRWLAAPELVLHARRDLLAAVLAPAVEDLDGGNVRFAMEALVGGHT